MGWDNLPDELNKRINKDSPFKGIEIVKKSYNKYRNQKTVVDGILFDSRKESEFYSELKTRKQFGDIVDFRRQVVFVLQDGFERNGKKIRPITYIADFEIDHKDGTKEVIDIKSYFTITPLYKVKKKMLLYRYQNIIFNEII